MANRMTAVIAFIVCHTMSQVHKKNMHIHVKSNLLIDKL